MSTAKWQNIAGFKKFFSFTTISGNFFANLNQGARLCPPQYYMAPRIFNLATALALEFQPNPP